jgi:nucleotide-binding universal stress UspA family protein
MEGEMVARQFEILLASDFTARSDRPLDRAVRLAADRNAKLVITHIIEKGSDIDDPHVVDRLKAELAEVAAGAELIVRSGSVPQTLSQIAVERESDLLVTGVARYNGIGDFFLGTAVDHIVRDSVVPVLIVRKRPLQPYRRLLVATDFSDCSRNALLAAARLFPDLPMILVNAFRPPYQGFLKSEDVREHVGAEAEQGMAEFIAQDSIPAGLKDRIETVVDEGEIGPVIVRQLEQTGADLLVIGTHGRSGFFHATIGSQAEALLPIVDVDVLMVRK